MPLEMVMLGEDGTPEASVPISEGLWSRLLSSDVAQGETASLLLRLRDYSGDAEFTVDDVPSLRRELQKVGSEKQVAGAELADLIGLCRKAEQKKVGLCALAD